MGLRLLGPIELVVDRQSLDLGGPRQRVVLAMLGLNANRVTPVTQLIDAVWDTSPPPTARGQIQVCVSALRKLFADAGRPEAIRTRPGGYVLEIPASDLDSEQFTNLVLQARAHSDARRLAEAAATLRRALALWRGPALVGEQSELVQRGAALLEDRRQAALEERLRLDLALGRHEEIIGELRALIDEHPLHEKLYGLLMVALYRSGRQAEALEVARQARTTLVEEVGVDPGQALQNLERAILNRDPALDLPRSVVATAPADGRAGPVTAPPVSDQFVTPRQLPASIADFTGRGRQLAEIKRLLTEPQDQSLPSYAVRIVAISGKGGVGKSTLAIRAAHELADAFPDGHLYAALQGAGGGEEATAMVLARFLRALGTSGATIPDDFQERVEMYRSRVADKRLLVVLDDLAREEDAIPLLPGSPTCAVITTSRARLSGLPGAHRVHVDVFDAEHSVELLTKIVGPDRVAAERHASVQLASFCDGLPLALRVAGARLASRPHWRIDALVSRLENEVRRLDELAHHGLELRSNIGVTYRGLRPKAKRLFRLFSLVQTPDFPAWTAAALLDTDLYEAEDVLESLVDAQMLDTVAFPGARQLRYRFHELIRVYAREQLLATETEAEREAALGRVLGAWLALAEEAHRKDHGGDYTILHGTAARWYPRPQEAGDLVGRTADWWTTERQALVAAIRQAAEAGMAELCWDLAMTSMSVFEARCYFDDWRETATIALDASRRAGNRAGEAAMLYTLAVLHLYQKRLDEAECGFTAALAMFRADGNVHGSGLALRNLAFVDGLRGRFVEMVSKYTEALVIMREVGDRGGEAHILRSLAKFELDRGDVEAAPYLLERSLAISREDRCLRDEAQVLYRFAELYLYTDRIDLARKALHRALRIVRDLGDPIGEALALYGLGIVRHREGRLDNAVTTLVHALDVARRVGEQMVEGQALYALGEIAFARGNHVAAEAHLIEAKRLFNRVGSGMWLAKTLILLSEVHSAEGDVELSCNEATEAASLLAEVDSRESSELRSGLERSC